MKNKNDESGFTLLEMVVVIAIIAILTAIAIPAYREWAQNARFRQAAWDAASVLRGAQSRAVAENAPYKVVFSLDNSTDDFSYSLQKNGTVLPGVANVAFPVGVSLYGTKDCNQSSGTFAITMNPNGTADTSDYICVMDDGGGKLYRTGVESTATGRVVVQKWDSAASAWK